MRSILTLAACGLMLTGPAFAQSTSSNSASSSSSSVSSNSSSLTGDLGRHGAADSDAALAGIRARDAAAAADFARKQDEYERELQRTREEARRIQEDDAAKQAEYQRKLKEWEAKVAACKAGDRTACAH